MTTRDHSLRRSAVVTVVGVAAIVGGGWTGELWSLGSTVDSSFDRLAQGVERDFAAMATALETTASELAARPDIADGLSDARLFEVTRASRAGDDPEVSVTVYDAAGEARAWAGRPSEILTDRILGERTFFVAPGPLGLRLVYVEPLHGPAATDSPREGGAVVAERVLSPALGVTETPSAGYTWSTPTADVVLRPLYEGAGTGPAPYTFQLRAPSGALLLDAEVRRDDLVQARKTWRRRVFASTLVFLAFAVVAFSASLAVRPKRGAPPSRVVTVSGLSAMGCVVAFALLRWAIGLNVSDVTALDPTVYQSAGLSSFLRTPSDLLLLGLLAVGLVLVGAFLVDQGRLGRYRGGAPSGTTGFLAAQIASASAVAGVLFGLLLVTRDTFDGAAVDLLHTSLQPWHSGRLVVLCGLILLSAASLWGCATVLVATRLPWRPRRHDAGVTAVVTIVWMLPGSLLVLAGSVPRFPYLVLLGGSVLMALAVPHVRPRFRHASHAARTVALFLALLVPALLSYPSLLHQGERTKQRFVESQYATQAARHSEELQNRLQQSLVQIDEIAELHQIAQSDATGLVTDPAFLIWRQTELARQRLASAVELYGDDGRLISRFALNFSEVGPPLDLKVTRCDWDVFGETVPFGSDERRVLHAERAICSSSGSNTDPTARAAAGSLVVHVAVDYRTLPFISSAGPYTELVSPTPSPRGESRAGRDVELAVYGWGLHPIFWSGAAAWSIDDALFQRLYASRDSFWTTLSKGGRAYRTYVSNNRVGIYALGYPVFVTFDHLVRLAEISTLVGLIFLLLAVATTLGGWLTPDRYRLGRALLREVRTSFYRRLFLAFIAVTLVPVLALAFVIRNYFTTQLRSDVEAGAARTAAVAQRVIEESFVPQQASTGPSVLINDDLLVVISQILDQEINIFRGSQLMATSERDLFASGLLPTRTPGAVYSAVALERLPSYVMQDALGPLEYLVAATPIRGAGADAILTVPLASRQQEIERQIEDLDRGILLGATLFILLGAGSGLYMAERIADPVKRLTRATGQIARGDFSAQVAGRSADELQRLVASFNRMAVDLKRQQVQLEKTHRLEAWADMARQVAHEIKNPLTPVQLSAEHLLQVHADRGEPLGPVLRSCVDSILTQVRLLRQISSEFSSYASSPTVDRKPTSLGDLVTTVLDPYLVGLENRVDIRVDVPDTVPLLHLDRVLVGRALTNVVENALHAMPTTGTLDVRGVVYRDKVELTVADSGVGLDPETLQRIFEPYFSTKVSGTGLGMAIAKRNVELSGGTVHVVSQEGAGTTVTLTFGLENDYPAERSSSTGSAERSSLTGSAADPTGT